MSDSRRRILERRARFVVAAVGSLAAAGCTKPEACLSAVADESKPVPTPPDTGFPDAQVDADAFEIGTVIPRACLNIARPRDAGTKPTPCLKVAPPDSSDP